MTGKKTNNQQKSERLSKLANVDPEQDIAAIKNAPYDSNIENAMKLALTAQIIQSVYKPCARHLIIS